MDAALLNRMCVEVHEKRYDELCRALLTYAYDF